MIRHLFLSALFAGLLSSLSPGTATTYAQDSPESEASSLININQASADELASLPGIGPSRAETIIAHRERRPFQRVEHLMRVRGIGRATFRRLRPLITVD